MKKYISILYILACLIFVSCDKLDLAPMDYYGSEGFWKNEAQVEGYVLGVHKKMRDKHSRIWLLGEARGGLQKHGTSSMGTSLNNSSPFKDQAFTEDNPGLSSWGGFYADILNINMAIDQLENGTEFLSDEDKSYYLGQMYGVRAWNYFYLYRTYGGVPLVKEPKVVQGVTEAKDLYLARSTAKETLDFIKSDIDKSLSGFGSNLSQNHNKSVWSKYASLMLKAEVYLWSAKVTTDDQSPASNDLTVAEQALKEVEGKFSLENDFSDVFDYSNKGNDEIIMALRFLETEVTNWNNQFTYSHLISTKYLADGTLAVDPLNLLGNGILRHEYIYPFFESFDALDKRRDATFMEVFDKDEDSGELINPGLILRKFTGVINSNNERKYSDDIPLYRYADVLLMLAEVENKKGGDPASYINIVRQRAYGEDYDAALHAYVNSDFAANELAILFERDKEKVWENTRWFDVRRMHDGNGKPLAFANGVNYGNPPLLDEATESHKLLWPVDLGTLNADPLLNQTEGYN